MKTSALLLGAVAVSALAAQADERGRTQSELGQQGAPSSNVLDFAAGPLTIDVPGTYELRRSWDVEGGVQSTLLTITADGVVVDLNGFELSHSSEGGYVVLVEGDSVTLRNGRIENGPFASVRSSGSGTTLDRVDATGYVGVLLTGSRPRVIDSRLDSYTGSTLITGDEARIEGSSISCGLFACLFVESRSVLVENSFHLSAGQPEVVISGDSNVVARNTVTLLDQPELVSDRAIRVDGSNNVIRDNIVRVHPGAQTVIEVNGTRNILDGNLAVPEEPGTCAAIGIAFRMDGNYYGDNRMAAITPFDLGATSQTDWGGNVGY